MTFDAVVEEIFATKQRFTDIDAVGHRMTESTSAIKHRSETVLLTEIAIG